MDEIYRYNQHQSLDFLDRNCHKEYPANKFMAEILRFACERMA